MFPALLKAQHFDSSAGKAVDLNRRWEPQQSCHFHGGRVLRVDDHGQTQLFTDKILSPPDTSDFELWRWCDSLLPVWR